MITTLTRITRGTVLLILVIVMQGRAGAEVVRMTIQDAVARAKSATIEVSESRRDLSLAKANLIRNRALLPDDPTISVGAYYSTIREDVFNDSGELTGRKGSGPNYTLGLSQEFEIAGQRSDRIDAAEQSVVKAKLNLEAQRRRLIADVKTAFLRALISNEKLAVAQRSLETAADVSLSRKSEGSLSDTERLDRNVLRIQDAHARRQLAQARQLRTQSFAALARLCRIPATQELELVGSPQTHIQPLAPLAELQRRALLQRSDLMALQHEVKAGDASIAAARGSKIPNVTISASVSEFAGATLAGGDVSVPIPVFLGKAGDVEESIAERNHAARQLDLLKADIEKEISDAYDACTISADDLEAYRLEIVPLNEENLRIQTRLYARDDIAGSDLIGTQVDYFTAQAEFLAAIEDYGSHLIELERAVGTEIGPLAPDTPAPQGNDTQP